MGFSGNAASANAATQSVSQGGHGGFGFPGGLGGGLGFNANSAAATAGTQSFNSGLGGINGNAASAGAQTQSISAH